MTAALTACLGKLPFHGDFVRWNHNEVPEIVEFDAWLAAGMERAYEARGRSFETDLRKLPALRFLYSSAATGRVLAGILVPSQDQVGRVYPFTLAVSPGQVSPGPAFDRLPLATAPVLDRALGVVGNEQAATLPAFLERMQALAAELDENAAAQELRSYLFGATLDQLFADWTLFVQPARRALFWQDLRQLMRPPFPPRYVAAWPCRGHCAEVAFWLTLLREWLPVRRNPALVLWPARSEAGALRILLDDLHPRYFAPALWPRSDAANLLDLGRNLASRDIAPASQIAQLRPRALLQDVVLAASRD